MLRVDGASCNRVRLPERSKMLLSCRNPRNRELKNPLPGIQESSGMVRNPSSKKPIPQPGTPLKSFEPTIPKFPKKSRTEPPWAPKELEVSTPLQRHWTFAGRLHWRCHGQALPAARTTLHSQLLSHPVEKGGVLSSGVSGGEARCTGAPSPPTARKAPNSNLRDALEGG